MESKLLLNQVPSFDIQPKPPQTQTQGKHLHTVHLGYLHSLIIIIII